MLSPALDGDRGALNGVPGNSLGINNIRKMLEDKVDGERLSSTKYAF
jgi:hypothetical protein